MNATTHCPNCGKPLDDRAPKGLCPECLLQAAFPTGTDDGGGSPRFVPPEIGELAGKFPQLDILELIGHGGMGAVYKARQKQLDRLVALKILPPQTASGRDFAGRFAREARALAKLNHQHIVALYEFGQADGLFYLLMEFVDGINLRQLLQSGPVAPKEALAIVPQICDALQYAHARGIVHRDIKPENILLSREGEVKIADFGVAKMIAQNQAETPAEMVTPPATGDLTGAGGALGTPQYMAPEQIKNSSEVDHRADIYSLGVVFYQMLTGELPAGKFEPPSHKVRIDVRLDEVVLRALEKNPSLRYQQVGDIKTQVETIAGTAGTGSETEPPSLPKATPVSVKMGLAGIILILGLLIAVMLLFPHWHAPQQGETAAATPPAAPVETKSDYIGQTNFPSGDSIEIKSVERTPELITVKGHYHLVSENNAILALSITATNTDTDGQNSRENSRQTMMILRGDDDFELSQPHPFPGLPHVSMYDLAERQPFADLYFGTKTEALAEGKLNLNLPHIVSLAPADNATNLETTQQLRLRFDQPMNPDGLNLRWSSGGFLSDGLPFYEAEQNEFVIPVRLLPGQTNLVTLNSFMGGFQNTNHQHAVNRLWHFNTRPTVSSPDAPRPQVTRISPAPGDILPVLTWLEITFDQPMTPPDQCLPYLWKQGWSDGPAGIIPDITYDPAARKFTIPLLLRPDNDAKLILDGFYSARGVAADPVVLHCVTGTNDFSRAEQDWLHAAASDPQLKSLLSAMKTARARLNSGVETVHEISLSGTEGAFNSISGQSATFKWQGNQSFADISDIMDTRAFLLGNDGKTCWSYYDDGRERNHEHILNQSQTGQMAEIAVNIADPFNLATRSVADVLADNRLMYVGQSDLAGRPCHRVQSWFVHQPREKFDQLEGIKTEWWIDAQTSLPVQVTLSSPYGRNIYCFRYEQLNVSLPDTAFAPPPGAEKARPMLFKPVPAPDEKRYLRIKDGSDGRWSGRIGRRDKNGRTLTQC